jgi:PAS domain S-box-containing protein
VAPGGPAEKAGIRPGDRLKQISGVTVSGELQVARVLDRVGAWQAANYLIERQGVAIRVPLVVGGASLNTPGYYFQWFLAFGYLLVGAVVVARRQGHPMVAHFAAFCLASFVLFGFSFTGRLDAFDRFIYWGDVWATLLTPALFLHFCLIFPGSKRVPASRRVLAAGGYIPVVAMLAIHHLAALGSLETNLPLAQLRQFLDQADYALLGIYFLAGAAIVGLSGWRTEELVLRQQRRWLAAGAGAGVLPFALFYIWPYVQGAIPGPNQSLSVFSLALVPLGFAYAIFRYRLMDVEWVVRRGVAYSLAAAALLGVFYGLVFVLSGLIEPRVEGLGPVLWVISVIAAALLFHPLRRRMLHFFERRRYRERYDYRRTLIDFASELSTELDAGRMIGSVGERLQTTLNLSKVAVFVRREMDSPTGASFRLSAGWGLTETRGKPLGPQSELDLSFLDRAPAGGLQPPATAGWQQDQPEATWQVMEDLGLSYYLPCQVRGRTIAFLGLSLTREGNYLTSEDVSLVRAVSGYFAIAVENSQLYDSLARKATEYQRLKDYSENIVESLSVGISAVDLNDSVESWNTQLELMFGISRQQAMGRRLADLLPAELVQEFDKVREESGVHTVYKFRLRAKDFPQEFRPHANGSGNGRKLEQERVLNVVITPLVAKNFDRIGRLVIFDDVTDRIELEEQLIQADKLSSIGLLAAGVAHEVNTPLAVISSYAQMLAKQVESEPNQSKMLQKITAQTFRASEIVNSLLNFSRTSTRNFEPVNLAKMLCDTLSFVEPQLRDAHVEIVTEFDGEAGYVTGNTSRLQQVFLNLFLNARDAMNEGGRLTVRTQAVERASGAVAEILVTDTGAGIDPGHLKRIFDPFFTTKAPKHGTGLGLAVSYGIVQEHSGKIAVDSKPGAGTSFRVELPLVRKRIHA